MQRMSRGPDHWHLNVNGLHSLNNVTARGSDQESFQSPNAIFDAWEKSGSLGKQKKKVICFQNFRNNNYLSKKTIHQHWNEGHKHPVALRSHQAREGFLAEKRHVAPTTSTPWHWGASTCPRPPWTWALPGGTLSKAPLRSAWRRWTCQASTARCGNPPRRPSLPVCRSDSVTFPAFSGEKLALQSTRSRLSRAASRGALGRQRRTPGLLRCSNERPGMMAHGDRTSRQVTKHPGRGTRCSLNIDATASLRVRPSSIKLKSFHLSSATAAGGGPRSGATSLCMLALDVPNFHMWSKRQNSCSGPLLLTTSWVSASTSAIGRLRKVMASREPKWRLFFVA